MNLIKSFENAYQQKARKGWNCIYVAVDVHGTIFKPTYSHEENFDYYPDAKEALQMFSRRKDIKLILWSASHYDQLMRYWDKLEKDEIHFYYINSNPEVKDTDLASFDEKFYFNVGIDDKFGFDPMIDWTDLKQMLKILAITRGDNK